MPYPHKNSDGKATLGHDENGKKKPELNWFNSYYSPSHPAFANGKVISNFHQQMEADIEKLKADMKKDQLKWQQIKENALLPKPGEYGPPANGGYVNFKIHKPDDPVLIKGKPYHNGLWSKEAYISPSPLKTIEMDVRVNIDGSVKQKVVGLRMPLYDYQDYTESQLRQMLMKSFGQITDKIIEEMKKEKK